MKLQNLIPRKLQMTAARRAPQRADEFEEPNMKLTNAFAVVLVLHVVAVGGIYAFNSLKAHKITPAESLASSASMAPKIVAPSNPALITPATSSTHQVKSGETLAKIAAQHGVAVSDLEAANGLGNVGGLRVGQELKIPAKAPSKSSEYATLKPIEKISKPSNLPKDSGQLHTVGKGETPVTIARKLNVSYDDLLKLNKIDDPKKLQIGQKLKVPAKSKS